MSHSSAFRGRGQSRTRVRSPNWAWRKAVILRTSDRSRRGPIAATPGLPLRGRRSRCHARSPSLRGVTPGDFWYYHTGTHFWDHLPPRHVRISSRQSTSCRQPTACRTMGSEGDIPEEPLSIRATSFGSPRAISRVRVLFSIADIGADDRCQPSGSDALVRSYAATATRARWDESG